MTNRLPDSMLKDAFLNPFMQVAIGAVLVTASELMLKRGAVEGPQIGGIFGIGALASAWTWGGIATYILSFFSWLYVLKKLPLGVAFTLINVVHVFIPLGAWWFLGEMVSGRRWFGIGLILLGIALVGRAQMKTGRELL